MQIQTAVIQVDCPNDGDFIIADERLCMKETWLVFINMNFCLQKLFIIKTVSIRRPFFYQESPWCHNTDINATLAARQRAVIISLSMIR